MNSLLEHFRMIDNQLKSSLDSLTENHELTASELVVQFLEELNKNHDSVISALFTRSSEV
jgi:deoxyhypusine synthase